MSGDTSNAEREPRAWPWLILILAAGLALAWYLIGQPWFAAAQYEEANPGLIALEALKGNIYPIYWGEAYGGTFHALVSALFFKLFGTSLLVFRLSNYFFWMVFLIFLYLLAKEAAGKKAGLMAAALMAVPPAAAVYFSLMGWTGYVATEPLGTALLWLIAMASLRAHPPRGSGALMFIAGVLAGIIFWIHLVGAPYIAAAGLAALWARPGRFFKRDLWLLAIGFLVGAAPLIHFILTQDLTAAGMTPATEPKSLLITLLVLIKLVLPQLLGAMPLYLGNLTGTGLAAWLAVILTAILGLCFLIRWLPALFKLPPLAGRPRAVIWMLALFVLASIGIWLISPMAGDPRPRYLHCLSSALPILTACAILALGKFNRALPIMALVLVLGLHLLGISGFVNDPRPPREAGRQEEATIQFMEGAGEKHFYAHYRVALPLAFMSWGRLTGADFFGCQSAPYLPLVDAGDRVALVAHRTLQLPSPDEMRSWLRDTLAAEFQEKTIGDFTVFHGITPPVAGFRPLDRQGWIVRAGQRPGDAGLCLDGDVATRWTAGEKQEEGQWLEVDLGAEQTVCGLNLIPGRWVWDGPMHLEVLASSDGQDWRSLARSSCLGAAWLGPHPRFREAGASQVFFRPANARYLRLRLFAPARQGHPYWWSMAELMVYTPTEQPPAPADAIGLLLEIRRLGADKVLARDHLAAKLQVASQGKVDTQLLYAGANSRAGCGWRGWPEMVFAHRRVNLAAQNLFILPLEDAPGLEAALKARRVIFHQERSGELALIQTGGPDWARLPVQQGWRVKGQGKEAPNLFAMGGGRWSPGAAQAPGQELELDLGRQTMISGLLIEHDPHIEDYPRGLKIMVSSDGQDWLELPANFATPRAWWSGRALMNDRQSGLIALWPRQPIRHLKLVLTHGHWEKWWSTTGITLLGPS